MDPHQRRHVESARGTRLKYFHGAVGFPMKSVAWILFCFYLLFVLFVFLVCGFETFFVCFKRARDTGFVLKTLKK